MASSPFISLREFGFTSPPRISPTSPDLEDLTLDCFSAEDFLLRSILASTPSPLPSLLSPMRTLHELHLPSSSHMLASSLGKDLGDHRHPLFPEVLSYSGEIPLVESPSDCWAKGTCEPDTKGHIETASDESECASCIPSCDQPECTRTVRYDCCAAAHDPVPTNSKKTQTSAAIAAAAAAEARKRAAEEGLFLAKLSPHLMLHLSILQSLDPSKKYCIVELEHLLNLEAEIKSLRSRIDQFETQSYVDIYSPNPNDSEISSRASAAVFTASPLPQRTRTLSARRTKEIIDDEESVSSTPPVRIAKRLPVEISPDLTVGQSESHHKDHNKALKTNNIETDASQVKRIKR